MKYSEIDYTLVAKICDKMVERGQEPKRRDIRRELGGGCYDKIAERYNEWSKRGAPITKEDTFNRDVQIALMVEVNKRVQAHNQKIKFDKDDLEEIISDIEKERDYFKNRFLEISEELSEVKDKASIEQGKIIQLEDENKALKKELEKERIQSKEIIGSERIRLKENIAVERGNAEKSRIEAAEARLKYEGCKEIISESKLDKEQLKKTEIENARLSEKLSYNQAVVDSLKKYNEDLKKEMSLEIGRRENIHKSFQEDLKKQLKERNELIKSLKIKKKKTPKGKVSKK